MSPSHNSYTQSNNVHQTVFTSSETLCKLSRGPWRNEDTSIGLEDTFSLPKCYANGPGSYLFSMPATVFVHKFVPGCLRGCG